MTIRICILAVMLFSAAGIIAAASESVPVPARESLANFPTELGNWQGRPGQPFAPEILAVLGVDEYANLVYVDPATRHNIGLYIGYYGSQKQGDLIHSPLNCLPGAGWEPISNSDLDVTVDGRVLTVNRYLIRKGLDRFLVLYWYQSHGRVVADEYVSRAYMVWDAMRSHRTDAALVRVIIPIPEDAGEATAERSAVDFVTLMFPKLQQFLPS